MVGAGASWRSATKLYMIHTYIHTYILVSVLNKPSQYRAVPQFWEWGTKQCCERSEQKIFGFLPQIVTFLRYISCKWNQKNCGIYLFWRLKGSSCPLLARFLEQKWGTNYITVLPPEILGGLVPLSPVIYTPLILQCFPLIWRLTSDPVVWNKKKRVNIAMSSALHDCFYGGALALALWFLICI